MTVILHYINDSTPDGRRTTALCGCQLTADRAGAEQAKATRDWVLCPLCELRKTLADMGLEPDPDRNQHERKWIQGALW